MESWPIERQRLIQHFGGSVESAVEYIANMVERGVIPFPRQSLFIESADVLFRNLQNYRIETSNERYELGPYYPTHNLYRPPLFRGKYLLIRPSGKAYYNIDVISDIFNEEERLKAKKSDQLSPMECWTDPGCLRHLVRAALDATRKPGAIIDARVLRDALFNATYEARQFRPTWIKGIIKTLFPGNETLNILDISSGWGDRLITAMSMGHNYLGFDPNTNLQPGYQQMISTFGHPDHHRVIAEPFEEANLPAQSFDLVLSSPPFFDLEIYTQQSTQSIARFPTFTEWIVGFLLRALQVAWDALKIGGYFAIHMGDTRAFQVCEPMNLFIEQMLHGSSWEGVIGLSGTRGRVSPVWVWKKVGAGEVRNVWHQPRSRNRSNPLVDRPFHRLYPNIWHLLMIAISGVTQEAQVSTISSEKNIIAMVNDVHNQLQADRLVTEWIFQEMNPILMDRMILQPNAQELLLRLVKRYQQGLSLEV
jgi:hypothetical protein